MTGLPFFFITNVGLALPFAVINGVEYRGINNVWFRYDDKTSVRINDTYIEILPDSEGKCEELYQDCMYLQKKDGYNINNQFFLTMEQLKMKLSF